MRVKRQVKIAGQKAIIRNMAALARTTKPVVDDSGTTITTWTEEVIDGCDIITTTYTRICTVCCCCPCCRTTQTVEVTPDVCVYFCIFDGETGACVEYPPRTNIEDVAAENPGKTVTGPFATLGECQVPCGDGGATCCDGPTAWSITVEGVTLGFADDCSGFNHTWETDLGTDSWEGASNPNVDCVGGGYGGGVEAFLWCNFPVDGQYRLELVVDSIVVADYVLDTDEWDCDGCNTMVLQSVADGCCNFPITTSVCRLL